VAVKVKPGEVHLGAKLPPGLGRPEWRSKALSAGAVAPGPAASTFRTGAEDNPTSCRPGR
jgi:hypothetical protein